MGQYESALRGLMAKWKTNREKVPIEILRTKYRAAYLQLVRDIKEVSIRIAARLPEWMAGLRMDEEALAMTVDAFNRAYEAGGYRSRIRKAMYGSMDADEMLGLLEELNRDFCKEAIGCVEKRMCLAVDAGPDGGLGDARLVSLGFGAVYDLDKGTWRAPLEGEWMPFLRRGE